MHMMESTHYPNPYVIGDLVLKKDFKRKKRAGGILDAQYVGPYIIIEVHGKGSPYILLRNSRSLVRYNIRV